MEKDVINAHVCCKNRALLVNVKNCGCCNCLNILVLI